MPPPATEIDLASRWLGASVIAASDESFGDKEELLKPGPAVLDTGRYGNRGEIVDGWETRRRREPGYDWAIIRLGTPGIITSVDVDTSFFTGNYPESCSIEAGGWEGYPSPLELVDPQAEWNEILPRAPLRGDAHNLFACSDQRRFSHVRLSIAPDGGVARLRVLGHAVPDPRPLDGLSVDLAAPELGSRVVSSSDGFYTSASHLNRPDTARTMGEGWETRRRRDAGHDFVIFGFGLAGRVRQVVLDTAHFKYNASAAVALYGSGLEHVPSVASPKWRALLERTRLQPDTRHVFPISVAHDAVSAIRLDAFPDGGLSRVRLIGDVDPAARRRAGYRWFNALPAGQALTCLRSAGVDDPTAAEIVGSRPVSDGWLDDGRRPGLDRGRAGGTARVRSGRSREVLETILHGAISAS